MRSRRLGNSASHTLRLAQLQQRMAEMERALTQRISQQAVEIDHLRAALQAENESASDPATADSSSKKTTLSRPSRRSLLRLGGAAAAGVAVTATGIALHPTAAQAAGVQWQTGTVAADTETIVKPSSANYSSPDLVQLQLGTGTVYQPVTPLKAALTAYDTTTTNVGVYGTSQGGYGLLGVTDTGTGATGAGINGAANSTGTGVAGSSASGIGVSGVSPNGIGGSFSGGLAPLVLGVGSGTPGTIPAGIHARGEIYLDSAANVYVCNHAGTTGSNLPPSFYQLSSISFLPAPVRIIGAGNPPGVTLGAKTTTSFQLTGNAGIPTGAKGVFGNATVYRTHSYNAVGYITIYPSNAPLPDASTLNYADIDEPLSNFVFLGLGPDGKFNVFVSDQSSVSFLFDVAGFIL